MHTYHVQHKIMVLLGNNANISTENPHKFTIDDVMFGPWTEDPHEFWRAGEWLVEADVEADDLRAALMQYSQKMSRIVPRIAFVGQAYINDRFGSIFIKRDDKDFGWFRSVVERKPVSLDFMDEELEALEVLTKNTDIPDAFYSYWNDAVNTTSYTGKLLLMFGAIDSFVPRGQRQGKRKEILGDELANEIYADDGLRNRLAHGIYLNKDDGRNYVELVHKKVLEYFNQSVLEKDILELNVVGPQRHFDENYEGMRIFVRQKEDTFPLDLHKLVEDVERGDGYPRAYEIIFDDELIADY